MSGATVLLLVALWALLLVPMLVRRHDQAAEVKSADRFTTAMRILSRRGSAGAARYVVPPPPRRTDARLVRRRQRFVVGLVLTWVVTLAAAVTTAPAFYALHALATVGLLLTVVSLRRQAARARERRRAEQAALLAERRRVEAARRRAAARARRIPPARIAAATAPRPAVRHVDPAPAEELPARPAAAAGAPWSPVPVPPPTYVMASGAPRLPRVVDLTKPGAWAAQQDPARGGGASWLDPDADAEDRRAVND